ncbi:penicillin-binding transpeptidase domain-containing protein [Cellulosilyticum sp. I15G10I2]|uniref:penicillin-binding transpeptidase domain-containing protein n=1 Tax=Cellulosilyticum sp. I15G10I2 TaxID=1892843 RepID=UPI00085C4667|nr:penicillin-binding transpeptidase domain-containing protein [Cellulosilyticum sp. I15G10I2]
MRDQIRNQKNNLILSRKRLNRRIFFIGLFFISAMGYMGYQVTAIKIYNGKDYQKQVLNRMMSKDGQINPQRGAIVDRNNKTIAASVLSYHVILDPKMVLELQESQQESIYQTLSEVAKRSKEEIKKFVEASPRSRYSILVKNIDADIIEPLKQKSLKGVWFEESFTRKYPKGEFASQLIGFYNKNGEGQYGIEQQYNDYIVGKAGRIFSQLQDEQIITTEIKPAENGATVVLTIDEVIQQYVENTMNKYIKEFNPINAAAIIMNPNTGEIYSMFSYPSFNPSHYNVLEEQLGKEIWESLTDSQKAERLNSAWRNYTIQNSYEPGSTFKPLLVAAALDESIMNPEQKYICNGTKVVVQGVAPIRCWKREGHGEQTLEQALANSCNVAMLEIVEKMSSETLLKYMERYGFGQPTDIGLPGEEKGQLHQKLGPIERATYSIGQTFTSTPMQLITAFSSIINGGYLLQPYVVSQIISDKDEMLYKAKPITKRQVITQETSRLLVNYLKKVVDEGTGIHANINGYTVGGKTGTAQKRPLEDEKYVLSFLGYAPINNPQVVGLIVFDEIPEGTGAPARAFKEMMTNILPYLEIDLANSNQIGDAQLSKMPQLTNTDIYRASELLSHEGLAYEIIGVGKKITSQYPNEGTYLPKNSIVKLYVQTETPESIMQIPDLQGLTVEEAKLLVKDTFVINQDSRGVVVKQFPKAGHKIEKNSQIIVITSE